MKDGMVFQFWMATGILVMGLITLAFSAKDPLATQDFRPVLAMDGMIGGAIWCCGNLLTVPIVSSIGLGLGLTLWGGVSLVVSFVIGLVGVLGLEPQKINEYFGIPGVLLAVASLIMFSFVQPTIKKSPDLTAAAAAAARNNDGTGEGEGDNA
jgi:hypothetical protein